MVSRWIAVMAAALVGACAEPPPRQTTLDPQIKAELDNAVAERAPGSTRGFDAALLPPLRMELPEVAGRPIEPRFDLSVSNAPAAQVFSAIVTGTRYSMLVHPDVKGSLTVNLKEVTIREALDSVRELYGYDYRIDGSRIFIHPAGLQTRIFRVNYLLGQRRGSSELRVQSASLSATAAPQPVSQQNPTPPAGTAAPRGSNDSAHVSTTVSNDFWEELRVSLTALVGSAEGRSVVISPQSGVVVVRAFPSDLRTVEQYLNQTRLIVERQVMLEAKIIEVSLSDAYQSGINWAAFRTNSPRIAVGQQSTASGTTVLGGSQSGQTLSGGGQAINPATGLITAAGAALTASNPASAVFGLALQTSNFAALLQFLESQGQVQVLSSPRVATLNNQKAVLKVGTDEFFVTNVSTVSTTTGTQTVQTPTVTVAPFFSGILLDVPPQIDGDDVITLHVHPSVSEVTESQRVVNLGGSVPSISLPLAKTSVNETDTIVRVNDGNIVAIGGLMSVNVPDNRGGLPGVSESAAFLRNTNRQMKKRELVILIKPTVIQGKRQSAQDARETRDRFDAMMPQRPARAQ
ncbi:MAG: secretin N-terminal domain-containing protein [Proteobacteria bacterium]|nr:secretin N-terminal domain-containing protein [Pseudomonadota bacterium]